MDTKLLPRRISVVVLTHNRADRLIATLEHLVALPESPPIFVADNGSSDKTVALVKALFPTVCVVECGENLGAAGRNRAVACVGTDYVAFCDDDTWWEAGSLERAVQLLDAWPDVGVLSARVVVERGDEEVDAVDRPAVAMHSNVPDGAGLAGLAPNPAPGPALTEFMARACVFRTALFKHVGGYESQLFIGGEEELVALDVLAANQSIVYCDQLTAHHQPTPSRHDQLRRSLSLRNAAWTAWLRLPLADACRTTLTALSEFARRGHFVRDSTDLLRGLRWALSRRQVAPPHVLNLRRQRIAAKGMRSSHSSRADLAADRVSVNPAMGNTDART
ncbi:glycosyltransferase family 2 protein [Paraburkholderia sp. BCC1886]|uniref:glycosyltransferase family 2 protein n=1 Tax=Paraburkholderia sp. BCC1886 TaxID=2562670 RepID=UPI001181F53D|nr:glycosyltransferase family 2 protein [Paraburkholderia sp. BCC1886]